MCKLKLLPKKIEKKTQNMFTTLITFMLLEPQFTPGYFAH